MGVIMGHENEHPVVVGVDIQIIFKSKGIRKGDQKIWCVILLPTGAIRRLYSVVIKGWTRSTMTLKQAVVFKQC